MKTKRVALAAALAAIVIGCFSNVSAQTYKRHALIEEGTGAWCGYCPYGAFTIDSMAAHMGDNLVAISWHGPSGYGEPLYLTGKNQTGYQAMDTLAAFDSIQGYPWASIGRDEVGAAFSGAYVQNGIVIWPNTWYTTAEAQANQAPLVDFRIVNATYSGNSIDFDLDITPFDLSMMPTEDTAKYVTVAVLTEDGPQTSQDIYEQSYGSIDGFVNYDVAREVGGKVLGDQFALKSANAWPIRRHYHMAANDAGSDWNVDSLRIKAFAAYSWSYKTTVGTKSYTSYGETYLDAGQTGYITKLPSTAPSAVWTVLPQAGANFSSDSTTIPIVWSQGGGVSGVKLEYSKDKGATWESIVSATSQDPYEWTLPTDAYGATLEIRVSDASNASTTNTGPSFSIQAAVAPTLIVSSPSANDSVLVETTVPITFTQTGKINESLTFEYSTDGEQTWNSIGAATGGSSYNWTVPDVATTTSAAVRVKDGNGIIGVSPIFNIVDTAVVSNVTVDGAPNLALLAMSTIHWSATGFLGESVDLDYYDPGQSKYVAITHGLAATKTSYSWNSALSINKPTSGLTIRVKYASGAIGTSQPFNVGSSEVSSSAPEIGMTVSPNPSAGNFNVSFSLDAASNVTLVVHDLLGHEMLRMAEGTLGTGPHEITIDGTSLPAGSYEYSLIAGQKSYLGKLAVIR